jgi:hypothetical protein
VAILEKEVWVGLRNGNIEYFEKLGYEIPRYTDKYRRIKVKRNTKILVKVNDLPKSSSIRLTKICDEESCGEFVHSQKYEAILRNRDKIDGKDRCGSCGRKRAGKTQRDNIRNGKSLESWAKENDKDYLLIEFSHKNIKKPNEISYGTADFYWWDCPKCKNEYDMSVHNRTSGKQHCPYCGITGRKRLLKGFNDLWTTHPDIAKLLKNQQNGYEMTAGSQKKEYFKCDKCGNIEQKDIMNVTRQGFSCSKCSDGNSYPEKFMISVLDQLNIEYEKQKVFKWSTNVECNKKELNGKKKYDFYIPLTNSIIEIHGIQHFEKSFATIKSTSVRSLEDEKENDKTKENLAVSNGILYITIDARKSSLEWIKSSIENSKLSEMFNLSKINWLKCHEFATSNLVEMACNYWKQGIHNTVTISQLIKCTRGTIVIYLKQGAALGWCDYDPREEMKKNWKNQKRNRLSQLFNYH